MRAGIYIIDLEQTILMIRRALNFIKKVCELRGHVFYMPSPLNIKSGRSGSLETAQASYLGHGTAPRSDRRPNRPLSFLVHQMQSQKKHGAALRDDRSHLHPEALFVYGASSSLLREAAKLQIPVIAILDSDSNPYGVQYPIPGNDDSVDAIGLYTELFTNAVADAKKNELKKVSSLL
jgi:small subunit ribosomal protein S2